MMCRICDRVLTLTSRLQWSTAATCYR